MRVAILLGATCASCALPGPPSPRTVSTVESAPSPCPSLELVDLRSDGIFFDISVPPSDRAVDTQLALWRGVDEAELEPWRSVIVDPSIAERLDTTGTVTFLDARPPQPGKTVRYALLSPSTDERCPPGRLALDVVELPATPKAPDVRVVGLTVRLDAPDDTAPLVSLYRRAVHGGQPPRKIATWDTSEPFVDLELEPGGIYAYSIANTVLLRDRQDVTTIRIESATGPETYAPVTPPDELAAPTP